MGKGKSSSAPQQTEVKQTTTNLPEYAAPYFTRLLGRTEYESLNPYRTYTGQRLAERSPIAEQVQARQTALGLAGAPREMAEASQFARQSVVNPQRFNTGIASMYMNPFQRLVTDIEKREATKASDITGEKIEGQAAQSGGLGGYREAILQAERQKI